MPMEKEVKDTGVPMWYVTFADLSTLMLTFFVLLISFANMDIVKFREMLGSIKGAFGALEERIGKAVPYLAGEEGSIRIKEVEKKKAANEGMTAKDKEQMTQAKQQMEDLMSKSGLEKNTSVFIKKDELVIRVDGGSFFKSGSASIQKQSFKLLKGLVEVMNKSDFVLTVEGHTDNVPIRSARYPSNWELSGVRATTVLRYMVYKGVDVDRLKAIGYADARPVADNVSPEGQAKNRRVEFILSKDKNGKKKKETP